MDRSFINAYEQAGGKITQSIQHLTREDLLAFPVPGTWSIQQVVVHLADAELVLADRMKRVIAEHRPALLAFDENKWAANLQYDEQLAADAAALIELNRRQLARVLHNLPDAAFDRVGIHSEVGPLTLRQLVEKSTSHLEHHLKFINAKREKLGKLVW